MRSFHKILKPVVIGFFLLAVIVSQNPPSAALADTAPSNLTVDQLMDAAQKDRLLIDGMLILNQRATGPATSHSGKDYTPFGTNAQMMGYQAMANDWVYAIEHNPTQAAKFNTEASPTDAPGISRGNVIEAWLRVCSYLPVYVEGYAISYPDFDKIVQKHRTDNDGGVAFTTELKALLDKPNVKDGGPVSLVFKYVREYANLLEKNKPGDGVGYLKDGDQFRGFMADLTQFGLGFVASGNDVHPLDPEFLSPQLPECVQQTGKTCTKDDDCNASLAKDWCQPAGIHLGNPCLMVVSDIIDTIYIGTGKSRFYPGQIEAYAPLGDFTSEFQKLRGGTSSSDFPCFMSGKYTSCKAGVRAYWFASPAVETKIVNEMLAATDRMAQYSQYLAGKIEELKGTGNTVAGPDITKIGSPLSLPLPLSDIAIPVLIGRVIKQLLSVVGALALAFFVWGGLRWMLARGAPEEIAKAKKIIVAAVSGLIAIFAAVAILNLIINAVS